eukprot:2773884-Rhodomonas_salina.1
MPCVWGGVQNIGSKFVLALGDNFYFRGVESASDPLWKSVFRSHPRSLPAPAQSPRLPSPPSSSSFPHLHAAVCRPPTSASCMLSPCRAQDRTMDSEGMTADITDRA